MATSPIPEPQAAAAAPASMGAVGRIAGVLFNPRPAFEDIVARPGWNWIVPLVIMCILSLAIVAIFGQRVGWRTFMERQFANNPRIEQLPPDQRDRALESAVKIAPIFAYVEVVLIPFVIPVIIASVLLGAMNLMAGARIQFKTSMVIVAYSWVPFLISGLIGILLLFIKPPDTIELEHLVASNVAAFLPDDAPKWLESLGMSVDLFSFWVFTLQAIGFAAASPKKLSFGKALAIIFLVWAIWVLFKSGLAGAFS
jgi:hypothetical protein